MQEEWSYIIEGEGTAHIGEEKIKVATGDFIAFPVNGKAHTIVNTGTRDLVYLTGGEDSPHEIGHFPSINKMIVFSPAGVESHRYHREEELQHPGLVDRRAWTDHRRC